VGEHCLLQVLACLRKAAKWQIGMHINKEWKPSSYMVCTLFDKTVGVHGFGSCAREFVKLIKPFNCKVRAYSPHVPDKLFNDYEIERADTLEDLFSQNEIVVDLAALTPETKGIVTEKLLKLIPEGGVFVNTGRGAVVDEEALSKVAKNKDIQIALDVFKEEPLPEDSPLRGCENIFLTPHIGGPTIDERKVCGLHALKNVEAFYEDKPLSSVIDLKSYDRMT
jgi:phosphoglycerate dehydrogenase-like enzyme